MGGVPVKHHTKSKVGRRRSHLALKPSMLAVCEKCKAPLKPHTYCGKCGNYKSKVVKAAKIKTKKN